MWKRRIAFCLIFWFAGQNYAFASGQYQQFQVTAVTSLQFASFMTAFKALNLGTVEVVLIEYHPDTQVLEVDLGGEDLTLALTALRTSISTVFLKVASVDTTVTFSTSRVKTGTDIKAGRTN